jgi:hypothetical protein
MGTDTLAEIHREILIGFHQYLGLILVIGTDETAAFFHGLHILLVLIVAYAYDDTIKKGKGTTYYVIVSYCKGVETTGECCYAHCSYFLMRDSI